MARIPQRNIENLVDLAHDSPGRWVYQPTAWSLYYKPGQFYRLAHYGTPICDLVIGRYGKVKGQYVNGKSPVDGSYLGGYSQTDVTGINSLAYLLGGEHVYSSNDVIYLDGTGPRFKKKKR